MSEPDFAEFYGRSFRPVSAVVHAFCGDRDLAHEATQEAFARAYARWSRVRDARSPQAWVIRTALNYTKKRSRRRADPVATSTTAPPSGERLDILAALRSLPKRQRQAVVLHYLADCSVADVAELMELSEGTVKSHLFKARAALRERLEVGHA